MTDSPDALSSEGIAPSALPIDELFSYAIMRSDLAMAPGKLASQAAHACAQSLIQFLHRNPGEIGRLAASESSGTRIILLASNEYQILRTHQQAAAEGIPCALFYDTGHISPPHFDGSRILTGLGLGPGRKEDLRHLTRKFRCA